MDQRKTYLLPDDSCGGDEIVARCALDVCVPIIITPTATVEQPSVGYCGQPVITPGARSCTQGQSDNSYYFTLSQTVCVTVPVQLQTVVTAEEAGAVCLGNNTGRSGGDADCSCLQEVIS